MPGLSRIQTSLNPDFKDILSEFIENNVEFLLVGAYALAAHGYPRATGDLDIWVKPEAENAQRTYTALAAFGVPLNNLSIDDLLADDMVLQIGVELTS